jgi:hypothetical protein
MQNQGNVFCKHQAQHHVDHHPDQEIIGRYCSARIYKPNTCNMPINKLILREWIQSKVKNLKKESETIDTMNEFMRCQGKLEVLKELYDDFNLEEVQHEEIIYHTDY